MEKMNNVLGLLEQIIVWFLRMFKRSLFLGILLAPFFAGFIIFSILLVVFLVLWLSPFLFIGSICESDLHGKEKTAEANAPAYEPTSEKQSNPSAL